MKIKVESEKIVKALKKLKGIEIVLENVDDAKEALNLILRKSDLFKDEDLEKVREVDVRSSREYRTSAVEYQMVFLLEFHFQEDTSPEAKIEFIKGFQEFLDRV